MNQANSKLRLTNLLFQREIQIFGLKKDSLTLKSRNCLTKVKRASHNFILFEISRTCFQMFLVIPIQAQWKNNGFLYRIMSNNSNIVRTVLGQAWGISNTAVCKSEFSTFS